MRIARLILETKISNVLIFRKNALFFAIDNPDNSENTDVVIILLRNNIDKENPVNMTPLSKSVQKDYLKITEKLLECGANPNVYIGENEDSLL